MNGIKLVIEKALTGHRLDQQEALSLAACDDPAALLTAAAQSRDKGHGAIVTWSPKVFIPLTQLCRDVCHYCTFAQTPKNLCSPYLDRTEVVRIAQAGKAAGCHEALFTLGDKPELRYRTARRALDELGHSSTLSYLAEMAQLVFDETGLLPHLNAGVMDLQDLKVLRKVSVSQGLMLESTSKRLLEKGGPHYGSPDKEPSARLATIEAAGQLYIPFTSGILIGIGESRRERIESILALRDLQEKHGHIQEVIIQNFRRKAGTPMENADEPSLEELLWTIAVSRLVLGSEANIQAPPNLSPDALRQLLRAGINDWGGVSPVTRDHVNPEAPWPHLQTLTWAARSEGKQLIPRLALYPEYATSLDKWLDPGLHTKVLQRIDASGYPRSDDWFPGKSGELPDFNVKTKSRRRQYSSPVYDLTSRAANGQRLSEKDIVSLFNARGRDQEILCAAANDLRQSVNGDVVSYIVTRNINYTNICNFKCQFCAFSKGHGPKELREAAYDLPLSDIQARVQDSWHKGAVEVCLQGGIHPRYTGKTYIDICKAIKSVQPDIHIHAFSPLEIWQGAQTLGISVESMLQELKAAGLGSLPGTAAEILDDEVRKQICPDKLNTKQWLEVMRTAHSLGLSSTATIMFGHVDHPLHWARHLMHIRDLQRETGGFTELVPLPFVHMEAPIYRKGRSRRGPTFRESVLMHAVARLTLHPHITNIQTSWTKMGHAGALTCLQSGANDLGGTLMNESISRAAGASHGQELPPQEMERLIRSIDRQPQQRDSRYQPIWTETVSVACRLHRPL